MIRIKFISVKEGFIFFSISHNNKANNFSFDENCDFDLYFQWIETINTSNNIYSFRFDHNNKEKILWYGNNQLSIFTQGTFLKHYFLKERITQKEIINEFYINLIKFINSKKYNYKEFEHYDF